MAAANPVRSLQEEATCSICLEYYKDPVTTRCGHNFCRSCISGWSQSLDSRLPCPQCREICREGDLRHNRQLQNVVEIAKQLSVQRGRPQRPQGENLCEEHEEQLKLFCEEDEKLICVICRESSHHRSHSVYPTKEAAGKYKGRLQDWLTPLRKEKDGLLVLKLKEEEASKTMRDKLGAEKQKTMAEFEGMRQLLKDHEQVILGRLEEMEGRIATAENGNIAKLSQQISSLSALITEIEKTCEQPAEELLKDVKCTLSRCESVKFRDPEKNDMIKKYKVPVTLDPDTAHGWLTLSEDGRRVTWTGRRQIPPDNPRRFTASECVLGRERFSSGRHYWEVKVLRDGWGWSVGVARESVSRKEADRESPKRGFWAVQGCRSHYSALTVPCTPLPSLQYPVMLGVYLDYEGGRLALYNANTMDHLYTFTGAAFTEGVYPYFFLGYETDLRLV
ncbi:E3 ubiquitin-protein ligase TRIM39-like [Ambystoma mexicanum]|uniref:E3 ubiquitin-protein ligase TRIM39-like n=1 Tax=Ambystoma mexicanum TaxID=8296 RepID=UPI0037E8CF6B